MACYAQGELKANICCVELTIVIAGRAGWELPICDCSPDIAVIDLSLPDISGMELARQVDRQCSQVKIIVLTVVHEDRAYIIRFAALN
jgi:DNA-binding NarL/FixJ family response regulator